MYVINVIKKLQQKLWENEKINENQQKRSENDNIIEKK